MAVRPRAIRAPETLLAAVIASVSTGCGQGTAAPATPAPVAPVAVAEQLSFAGVLVGEQHPIHVYEAVVAGKVGAHSVGLVLLVEPVVRTVVGTHRIAGDNTPSFPGQGLGYLWVDDQFWRYPAATPTSTVVVAADGLSGTAAFQVGNVPGGGASAQSIAVSGGWRCAPATR